MVLAIDVHYKETYAKAVSVLFNWSDEQPISVITSIIYNVEEYQSGQFYKRELPCIMEIIKQIDKTEIKAIIVDGHVFVDNNKKYGLGGYLWDALKGEIPIIGVAKKSFIDTDKVTIPVFRGESKQPLYISSIGIELIIATNKILSMSGIYRIPKILKTLDQFTKEK